MLSCNGYFSASDLRIHFGLGEPPKLALLKSVAVRRGGFVKDLDVNRLYVVQEGGKILKNEALAGVQGVGCWLTGDFRVEGDWLGITELETRGVPTCRAFGQVFGTPRP